LIKFLIVSLLSCTAISIVITIVFCIITIAYYWDLYSLLKKNSRTIKSFDIFSSFDSLINNSDHTENIENLRELVESAKKFRTFFFISFGVSFLLVIATSLFLFVAFVLRA
jgi:hypothetical protein